MKAKCIFLAITVSIFFMGLGASCAQGGADLKDLQVGQRLAYQISYNGIPVGTVSTTVEELTEVRGRPAYKVVLCAKTNLWASLIYNVDDRFITYIDYETSNSLRHEVARSEGSYRKRAIIEYIYDRFLAEYRYLKSGRKKTINIASNIQDPLSAAYYFMRRDFEVGDEVTLNIDLNEKHHKLYAKIEKGRNIHIPKIGKTDTLIIRPYVERKGKPYKRGRGWVYISTAENNIPVYAVVRVFIWGRFTAILLPQPQ